MEVLPLIKFAHSFPAPKDSFLNWYYRENTLLLNDHPVNGFDALISSTMKILGFCLLFSSSVSLLFCAQPSNKKAPSPAPEITQPVLLGERPLFKDFMGINGHFPFKPDLYSQVCRLIRNYHNIDWDVENPGDIPSTPHTTNGVNWKTDLYLPLKNAGFETDICLQFASFSANNENYKQLWKGKEQWSYDYAKSIAQYYGPSGTEKLATSLEIGNEPGDKFDTNLYRALFKNMAQGIRDGDSKIKIVTPYVTVGKPNDYAQNLKGIYAEKDILPLYDVINLHSYASVHSDEGPFNRSYPEDSTIDYLKEIDETLKWRDKNAPDKEVWITEFGYDASTPEAMDRRTGWGLKLDWQGYTEEQQAQYLVRSYFAFAERGIQRAYLFYYNDEDTPFFHSSSGITRFFQPKMSFWALKQLYETLGNYRLHRIVKKIHQDMYLYEFEQDGNPDQLVWVIWSPTGTKTHEKDHYIPRTIEKTLNDLPAFPNQLMAMATSKEEPQPVEWTKINERALTLTIGESPVYLFFDKKHPDPK